MLGTPADQRGLCEADQLFVKLVPDSFYGQLAALQGQLFRDEELADFYGEDNGRNSRPPSLMALEGGLGRGCLQPTSCADHVAMPPGAADPA